MTAPEVRRVEPPVMSAIDGGVRITCPDCGWVESFAWPITPAGESQHLCKLDDGARVLRVGTQAWPLP